MRPTPPTRDDSRQTDASLANASIAEQDLDLILQVEDHDKLDFEPDEGVLDNTTEVHNTLKCFRLRDAFRTRGTRNPTTTRGRNEDLGCYNKLLQSRADMIHDLTQFYTLYSTLIYYIYYLYQIGRAIVPQISNACTMSIIVCQ